MTTAFTADLVLAGGTVVTGRRRAIVPMSRSRTALIVAVGAPARDAAGARDASTSTGLHLLPGAIDVHVHFREPGYTAQGGLGERHARRPRWAASPPSSRCPTPSRRPVTPETCAQKHEIAAEKAHVDFGIYGLLAEDNIDELAGPDRRRRQRLQMLHGQHLRQSALALDRRDAGGLRDHRAERASASRCMPRPPRSWHARAEAACGRRAATTRSPISRRVPPSSRSRRSAAPPILAEWTGARIHILHISSAAELAPLAEAKARGVDITGETCPHYLLLDYDDYARLGSIIRVNPPVREPVDRRRSGRHCRRHGRHDRDRPRAPYAGGEDART